MTHQETVPALQALRKSLARHVTGPVIRLLARTPVTPNALTVFSLAVTAVAGALIATGHLFPGGLVVLFASLFDILDGALARNTSRVTKFGGALDSTLDRLAEGIVFVSLMVAFARQGWLWGVGLAGAAMTFSFLVSYIRARAEGLGLECQVGVFTRSERIILLVAGLLLGQFRYVLAAVLVVIAVLSAFTAGQRLFLVWQKTRR